MPVLAMTVFESNDALASRIKLSMQRLGYPQLAGIQCEVQGSTVVLNGELRSYFLSQVAQSIAARVPGIQQVVNNLRVALA